MNPDGVAIKSPRFSPAMTSPPGTSNIKVAGNGTAQFAINVPPRYDHLTISFSITDDPARSDENCINGSQEEITPLYGPSSGLVEDIATGTSGTIDIPPGISGFRLLVEFTPPPGFT